MSFFVLRKCYNSYDISLLMLHNNRVSATSDGNKGAPSTVHTVQHALTANRFDPQVVGGTYEDKP